MRSVASSQLVFKVKVKFPDDEMRSNDENIALQGALEPNGCVSSQVKSIFGSVRVSGFPAKVEEGKKVASTP